jgi:hypothetical protein
LDTNEASAAPDDSQVRRQLFLIYCHALDALRYLILKLDAQRLARKQWSRPPEKGDERRVEPPAGAATAAKAGTPWPSVGNEELWRRIFPGD